MFYVGVDLGQKQDHTAIAIVERRFVPWGYSGKMSDELLVRRAQRVALGTPYPRVVEMLVETVRGPELAGQGAVSSVV